MNKTKVSKKTKAPLIPETPKTEVIPKDLQDLWGAAGAAATAFNCLKKGHFTHDWNSAVTQSLGFLAKLHEQTVESCLKHPQAYMIPELKAEQQKKKEGKANGQEKAAN